MVVARVDLHSALAPADELQARIFVAGLGIALLLALLGWLTSWNVIKPLRQLALQAERIHHGETGQVLQATTGRDEVSVLSRTLSELVATLHAKNCDLENTARTLRDEIKLRKNTEQHLLSANRLLELTVQGGHELVQAEQETAFLEAMCQMLVQYGGFHLACIGYHQDDCHIVKSASHAQSSALQQDFCHLEHPQRAHFCMVKQAIGTQSMVLHRVDDPDTPQDAPWRTALQERGCQACIAFPLQEDQQIIGALALYSTQPNAFADAREVALLQQLTQELALGVEVIRAKQARDRMFDILPALPACAACVAAGRKEGDSQHCC